MRSMLVMPYVLGSRRKMCAPPSHASASASGTGDVALRNRGRAPTRAARAGRQAAGRLGGRGVRLKSRPDVLERARVHQMPVSERRLIEPLESPRFAGQEHGHPPADRQQLTGAMGRFSSSWMSSLPASTEPLSSAASSERSAALRTETVCDTPDAALGAGPNLDHARQQRAERAQARRLRRVMKALDRAPRRGAPGAAGGALGKRAVVGSV